MATRDAAKDYVILFGGAMLAYVVVLVGSILLIQARPGSPLAVPIALAPVVPAVLGILALVRFVNRMDELQRRIQYEGLALSAGVTAVLTFSYGFLENVGFPHLSLIWIFPMMVALWGIGVAVASWRYR